jgi:hypothetical protein
MKPTEFGMISSELHKNLNLTTTKEKSPQIQSVPRTTNFFKNKKIKSKIIFKLNKKKINKIRLRQLVPPLPPPHLVVAF